MNQSPTAAEFKLLGGGLSQLQQENPYICWRQRVGLGAAAAPKILALGRGHSWDSGEMRFGMCCPCDRTISGLGRVVLQKSKAPQHVRCSLSTGIMKATP